MKEIIIKFRFNDDGGYKGKGDTVAEVVETILKNEIQMELVADNIVKNGWELEVEQEKEV